jgi:hypothetical protein
MDLVLVLFTASRIGLWSLFLEHFKHATSDHKATKNIDGS